MFFSSNLLLIIKKWSACSVQDFNNYKASVLSFSSPWVPPDLSILQFLTYECHVEWSGGWREREKVREKERKGERMRPIFIAWLRNENLTLSGGGLRKVRAGTDRWGGMKCVPSHVWSMYLFVCVHVYLYPCDTCVVTDSRFLTLSVSLCFLSHLCPPLPHSLSLSHTLHTMPLRE